MRPKSTQPEKSHDGWTKVGVRTSYGICGITHTICSHAAMDSIVALLTEPVQSWDALICTSRSVRAAVEQMLTLEADYLETRIGARPSAPVQLPVIPLGVDAPRFAALGGDPGARRDLRTRLGVSDGGVAVLFFGWLAMHAKAHPHPMLVSMQRAQAMLSDMAPPPQLHFIFTGQFPVGKIGEGYRAIAATVCSDVRVHFLNGADPELAGKSWAAADLFMSLSENIQESFGITPVEAMAAGLPCVVSDWDGYVDTVVEGQTGFRAPTLAPPPGAGKGLARSHQLGALTYGRYIDNVSQVTSVSIETVARGVARLASNPDLRAHVCSGATPGH